MKLVRRAGASALTTLLGSLLLWAIVAPAAARGFGPYPATGRQPCIDAAHPVSASTR